MTTEQIQYLLENDYIRQIQDSESNTLQNLTLNDIETNHKYTITIKLYEYINSILTHKVNHFSNYTIDSFIEHINNDLLYLYTNTLSKIAYLENVLSIEIKKLKKIHDVLPKYYGNNYSTLAVTALMDEIEHYGDIDDIIISLFFIKDIDNSNTDENINEHFKYDVIDWFVDFIDYRTKKADYNDIKFRQNGKCDDSWIRHNYEGWLIEKRKKILENARHFRNVVFLREKITEIKNSDHNETIEKTTDTPPTGTNVKLKWLGTVSQFGFIINELIGKGYIEKPTSSFPKDAKVYLSHFDINTTEGSLIKEINENSNSIAGSNAGKLSLPPINKLP